MSSRDPFSLNSKIPRPVCAVHTTGTQTGEHYHIRDAGVHDEPLHRRSSSLCPEADEYALEHTGQMFVLELV